MENLKKYSTAQLVNELRSREDDVIVCSEPVEKPYACIGRGQASNVRIPAGYAIIAVKVIDDPK